MSTRIRNGKLYYRKTVTIDGKRHWLERSEPIIFSQTPSEMPLIEETIQRVFLRFQEPHTAFLPLCTTYYLSWEPKRLYGAKWSDLEGIWMPEELKRAFSRQRKRILDAGMIFHYSTESIVINLQTGKSISHYQTDYISKVIRNEIDPSWNWNKWKSQKIHGA